MRIGKLAPNRQMQSQAVGEKMSVCTCVGVRVRVEREGESASESEGEIAHENC